MATKVGDAFVEMSAKDTQLAKDLGTAQGKVNKSADAMAAKLAGIGKGMAIAGAAITAALGAIIMKTAAVGDQFDKMSLRTGVTVEELSALAYAADISGTDIGTLEKGLKGLTKTMDDASRGIGEGLEAFEELDIAVVDSEGNLRSTVDVLKEAATKIAAIENPTKQAAYAMDLFGAKAGPQLLPLLKAGGAGIDSLMKKAEELGITMSTEAATAAAEFTDRLADLKGSLAGAGREIGNVLIPIITPLIEKVVEIIGKIKAWAEENKPLVETIVKFTAAAGIIMVVLGPILIAIPLLIKAFAGLKIAIVAIKVVITALTGPIGWVILAVGALALAWTTNFGGIRDFTMAVVEKVKEALGWLWDKVKWVLEKLGLYKETAKEVTEANKELTIATGEAATAADTFTTANTLLGDSLDEIQEKAKEAGEAIKIYTEDVVENYIALSVAATESWEAFYTFWGEWAKRTTGEVTKTQKKFADAMQPIYDRLYEMSHTEEEVAIKTLKAKRDALIETVKTSEESAEKQAEAISKIEELYRIEVDLITGKLEEQRDKLIETAETSELSANKQMAKIREIKEEYNPLIDKLNEVAEATEDSAERQVRAIRTVVDATGKIIITNLPAIQQAGSYEEAQAIVAANIPTYQHGTPYVPRTGLAMVHKGEEINPPGQRSYDNRKSYTSSASINIQPGGIIINTPKFGENDAAEMLRLIKRRAAMQGYKFATA